MFNLLQSEEMNEPNPIENVSYLQMRNILQLNLDSMLLKYAYMMMIAGRTIPKFPANGEYIHDFVEPYISKVGWKVTQTFEAALLRKK